MEKFKSERGSATVVTLTVVLFFTIILMGIYVSANNANKAQKNADTTIIDKYGEDVNFINEVYNERVQKKNSVNSMNYANIVWNSSDIVYLNENMATVSASVDITDGDVEINSCKLISNNEVTPIGTESDDWNSADAVQISNKKGTVQVTTEADKTLYIHVLVVRKDSSKGEAISKALKVKSMKASKDINYTYEITGSWGGNGYLATYQTKIIVRNDIQDFKNWKVSFNVPEGLNSDGFTCYGASKVEINNNIVTLYSQSWNGDLNKGDYLQIECQITFKDSVDFDITNVELTGEPKTEYNYNNIVEKEENGIKYKYEVTNNWGDDNSHTYQFRIYITANDDITDWNTSFRVPQGIKSDNAYCWNASKVEINGQNVKVYPNDWNKSLKKGDILELNFQFTFNKEIDFKIENLQVNTK